MEGDCSAVVSSRPLPVFPQSGSFSQRKRTPFRVRRPCKPTTKSCPPVSRLSCTATSSTEPQLISFKSEKTNDTLTSPHYNSLSHKTYLEQCFQICDRLGGGSFGEVFQVRSRDDGKMYAVKRSLQHFRGEKDRRLKLAEVERHERLPHHPNCVQFHQAWEERRKLYIQTELCQMSLSEYADLNGRIPEPRVWDVLVDLVKGLKHLHDHGLCHLDIKPANVFLAEEGFTCKLGDFGLCSSLDQTFVDSMEGDARYLAPELLDNQFGKAADIFSLGISMLELACDLELPTEGENWHLLRQGHIPPHLVQGLSPGLVDLLSRMMHPDPQLRPNVDDILDCCVRLDRDQKIPSPPCWQLLHKLKKNWSAEAGVSSLSPVSKEDGATCVNSEGMVMSPQDDSLYSDDDGACRHSPHTSIYLSANAGDEPSSFNQSWIRHGPVGYPNQVYSGPPIPLEFGDSFDSPCDRPQHSSSSPSNPKLLSGPARKTVERKNLLKAFKSS